MRGGSLFSGIGGLDLGFEQEGFEIVWQCEVDKHAQKVLRHHWPNIRMCPDVRLVGTHYPFDQCPAECEEGCVQEFECIGIAELQDDLQADVIIGGIPCQDASIMQGRHGARGFGQRTGLFWDAVSILKLAQPRVFVLENVKGLLSADKGRTFRSILCALDDLGFDAEWRVVDGAAFGLPLRREHLILVAFSRTAGGVPEGFGLSDCDDWNPVGRELRERAGRTLPTDGRPVRGRDYRMLTPSECEVALGFPPGWTDIGGQPDGHRYHQLGNAVCPPVARWIANRIKEVA